MIVLSFPADTAEQILSGEQTVVTYPTPYLTLPRPKWEGSPPPCGFACECCDAWDQCEHQASGRHTATCGCCPYCCSPPTVDLDSLVGQTVAIARLHFDPCDKVGETDQHEFYCPLSTPGAIVGSATVAAVQQRVGEDRGQVGWAVILTDAASCEQRCPIPDCKGPHQMAPIPYDQPGPISEWTPWIDARKEIISDCRHCGEPIRSDDGVHWRHGHGLIRCQTPGRPYGYDALPPADGPCTCWACERFGQTSPADNTGPSSR